MPDSQPIENQNSKLVNSNVRILLWDIDGTLTRSVRQGVYKEYFAAAMEKVYGSRGNLDSIQASGMTDMQIMLEALRDEGFTPEKILGARENLLKTFREEMLIVHNRHENHCEILEGVSEILEETGSNPNFINALLTGNLSCAAEIKLQSVGLWKYFEGKPNAFGEISHDRRELARQAGKLFNEFYNFEFKSEQFIVIGDTPNDIACARALGAKAVAVATGKNHPKEDLAQYEPDFIFDDLKNTAEVLKVLSNI
ncbi:MAG: HAD hydrolase-like protein [Pyrinomonadaceae bacterium]